MTQLSLFAVPSQKERVMNKMSEVLDAEIAKLPEDHKGALEGQVILRFGNNAMIHEGTVRKHPIFPEVYIVTELLQPRPGEDPRTAPKRFADFYFDGNNLEGFVIPKAESTILSVNKSGIHRI